MLVWSKLGRERQLARAAAWLDGRALHLRAQGSPWSLGSRLGSKWRGWSGRESERRESAHDEPRRACCGCCWGVGWGRARCSDWDDMKRALSCLEMRAGVSEMLLEEECGCVGWAMATGSHDVDKRAGDNTQTAATTHAHVQKRAAHSPHPLPT